MCTPPCGAWCVNALLIPAVGVYGDSEVGVLGEVGLARDRLQGLE